MPFTSDWCSQEPDATALDVYGQQRLDSFKDWAAALMKSSSSLVPGGLGISHAKQSGRSAESGDELPVSMFTHPPLHSHATHAVQRGVDVFTLQATLGHSSSATTGH